MNKKLTIILSLCWISLLVAGGIWAGRQTWPPVLTWQSPLPTATPAGPTPIPTPEFCISQHHDCVLLEFLGYQHHGDGTTTLRYRITNHCADRVEYFAIETGFWTRLAPADGATYQGDLGSHTVRWVDDQPSIPTQGLRFDGDNDAFKEGAAEVYTFTVRDFTPRSPNTGRVVAGKREYAFRLMLLDPTCEVGVWPTPRPTPTLTPVPFSPLPTPTPTPEGGVVLPTEPVVAECVFGPPAGGMPPEEPVIPLSAYSFSEPTLVLTNTVPIGIQQWLPDSETLLVTRHTGYGNQLELLNVHTRIVTQLIAPNRAIDAPRWLATDHSVFWRELGSPDNEPGYWLRSFDPPGERRLSDNGTGAGVPYAVSPDGTQVLFLALPAGTQPFLWNQVTKMLRALPVDLATWRYQNSLVYPFQSFNVNWQPGGDKILFWDGTWTFLYDLATNSGCEINMNNLSPTFPAIRDVSWAPDSRYLLFKLALEPFYTSIRGPHGLLLILDTYTGDTVQFSLANSVTNFTWAPDSQTVAMFGDTEERIGQFPAFGFYLLNVRSGEYSRILPQQHTLGAVAERIQWAQDGETLAIQCMDMMRDLSDGIFDRICFVHVSINQ